MDTLEPSGAQWSPPAVLALPFRHTEMFDWLTPAALAASETLSKTSPVSRQTTRRRGREANETA